MIVSLPVCVNVCKCKGHHPLINHGVSDGVAVNYHHKPPGKDRITWPRPSLASNSAAPAASRCWSKGRVRAGALWWGLGRQRPGSVAGDGVFLNGVFDVFLWFLMVFDVFDVFFDGFWCFFIVLFIVFFVFDGVWWFLWFLMVFDCFLMVFDGFWCFWCFF